MSFAEVVGKRDVCLETNYCTRLVLKVVKNVRNIRLNLISGANLMARCFAMPPLMANKRSSMMLCFWREERTFHYGT